MNCVKSILFIPIVETNLEIIICKNKGLIYDQKLICFKKKHYIYFIMSLLCFIILIYMTYIFITFSFNKVKHFNASIAKYLIMNSSKSFFLNKLIILIIQRLNAIHSMINVIYFFTFFFSYIHIFCFMTEYHFQDDRSFNTRIYYYCNYIYIISTTILFIGFLIRKENFEGLIFVFFLFIIILIILIFIWPKQFLKNSILIHFTNDFDAYNQIRIFIKSVKERKMNRENLLDFLIFCSFSYKNTDKAIDEENFINHLDDELDYKLSEFIESTLKNKVNQYNKSILLKCIYANYLYNDRFKYNKAFLIILSLYEDISQKKIPSNLSQEFYIYRLKRNLETNCINLKKQNDDKNVELSTYYQVNNLLLLILKNSEMYYEFWNILYNYSQHKDILSLEKLGNIINIQVKQIHELFKSLYKKKLNNKKIILLYIYFLRDILNENEMSNNIMEKEKLLKNEFDDVLNNIIGGNNKVYELNEIESNSNLQFIISSGIKQNSVGFIEKISYGFSKKLGYNSNELIGKSINILLPDFLKENHEKVMIKKFSTYKFKEEFNSPKKIQGLFYMKNNSMYLVPVYMETYLIFDEDYIPHSFTKLENEKEVFFHQNLYNTCHVATNKRFLIQNFTPNSIQLLNLTDKDFNGTVDITFYLKEFCEDVKNFYNNRRQNFNEEIIKNILIRKKYFLKQGQNEIINYNVITWKKNNKTFNLYCEEIRMNKELLGFYFHFEKSEKNINSSSNDIIEINLNEKKFHKIVPKQKSSSCIFISNSFGTEFQNGEFKINSEIIPTQDQVINFDFKKHSYILKDKKFFNENKNYNEIQYYINKYYTKTNIESDFETNSERVSIDNSDENKSKSSNISSYSYYSSSFSSEKENEKLNDFSINKKRKKSIIVKQSNIIDYYKVNLKKITFYYYNFSKNLIQEIPNFINECKIEKILKDKTNTKLFIPQRRDSRIIHFKKPKFKNINNNLDKKKEIEKVIKNDEIIINTTKSKINDSIYFLIFSVFITFLFSFFFTFSLIFYSLHSKKVIFLLINSINCLNNLNNNIGETFYYSVKLTLVQNNKYTNISPSNEQIKIIARNYLNSIYKEMIDLLDSLYFSSISYSKNIKKKIDNYKLNLSIITDQGYEQKIEVPVLNILEEYSTLIFQYAHKNDNEINLIDKTFNNLLRNSENFLYGYFYEYTELYLEEYAIKIKKHKIITYCFSFILIPFEIFGLFLILKSNFKVSSEKEKYINFFFQIDKKTIETSLKLCKQFMEITNISNNSIKYLVSAPKINLEILNKSELSEETNNNLFSDINYYSKINNNNLKSKNEKKNKEEEESIEYSDEDENNNLTINNEIKLNTNSDFLKYEKKAFKYIFFYITFFGFFTLIGILTTFLINKNYENIKGNHDLYSITEKYKLFIMRNVIFFRIFLVYKSSYAEFLFLSEISNELKYRFDSIFENNTNYVSEIYSKVNNSFLSSQTKNFYHNIQKNSLCNYLTEFTNNYGGDCNIYGNGIVNYGIISLSMYIIHSLMHLYNQALIYEQISIEKAYYYSELFFGTVYYFNLSPIDETKIEEYESLDPFNLLNTKIMNYLIILNDYVFKPCCTEATALILDDIKNIGNYIKRLLIGLIILYISLFILFSVVYIIPNIARKNMNINKKRKMLLIIPRNILFEIIMKNK